MQVLAKSVCIYFLIVNIYSGNLTKAKPIRDEYRDDTAISGMKKIEQEASFELPRKILAGLLNKGQFFQDIFAEQPTPNKIQFGHVCENPQEWEQRFEERDLENNRHQGKVRWGDQNGAYGEHYWDLNHAGVNDEEHEQR